MLGGRYEPEVDLAEAPALLPARDRLFAVRVHLLVLRPPSTLLGRLEALRRLRQMAQVEHPDLARITGVGEHEGLLYAALQPLRGDTSHVLHDLLLDRPPAVPQVRQIGAAVLGALGALHRAGLVHGDVTPGAVLVAGTGGSELAVTLLPASLRAEAGAASVLPGRAADAGGVEDELRQVA